MPILPRKIIHRYKNRLNADGGSHFWNPPSFVRLLFYSPFGYVTSGCANVSLKW